MAGCASGGKPGTWEGPVAPVAVKTEQWTWIEKPGVKIQTENYIIYSTLQDPEALNYIAQIMQGGHAIYKQFAPQVIEKGGPLECYIFQARSEWEQFTMRYGGPDAQVYMKIRNGGYTQRDRYVAHYNGRYSTYSVASHEGWHQFAGRNFIGRLPPFMDEGIACMVEELDWVENLPRWNLSSNQERARQLRSAADSGIIIPLRQLCMMHAGDVVGGDGAKIDAFYAQSWAFARFMWEYEHGRFRPNLAKWILETANGTVYDPSNSHKNVGNPWNRMGIPAMIEHYLELNFDDISRMYSLWVKHLAYEEFNKYGD